MLGENKINFNKVDKNDNVVLGVLVKANAMAAARVVVKHGAVVDRVNRGGMAGLHDAVCRGAKEEVGRWIGLGTNPDKPVVNRDRKTPLMLATEVENVNKNDELCSKNKKLCSKTKNFVLKMMNLCRTLWTARTIARRPSRSCSMAVQILTSRGTGRGRWCYRCFSAVGRWRLLRFWCALARGTGALPGSIRR